MARKRETARGDDVGSPLIDRFWCVVLGVGSRRGTTDAARNEMRTIVEEVPASLRDHLALFIHGVRVARYIHRILSLLMWSLQEHLYACGINEAPVRELGMVPEVRCDSQVRAWSVPKLAGIGDCSFSIIYGALRR